MQHQAPTSFRAPATGKYTSPMPGLDMTEAHRHALGGQGDPCAPMLRTHVANAIELKWARMMGRL